MKTHFGSVLPQVQLGEVRQFWNPGRRLIGALTALAVLSGCGGSGAEQGGDNGFNTVHNIDGELINEAAVRRGKEIMKQEGLLDESLQPVNHEVINISTKDRPPEHDDDQMITYLQVSWLANRNGRTVITETEFPRYNGSIQIETTEDPEQANKITFTYDFKRFMARDDIYLGGGSITGINSSCIQRIVRDHDEPSKEMAQVRAQNECIVAEPWPALNDYINRGTTLATIMVTKTEFAQLDSPLPRNG